MMPAFDAEAVESSIRIRTFRRLSFMRFERVERGTRNARIEAAVTIVSGAEPLCGATLECGSQCILERGHARACECAGDEPWQPGSCPA